MWGKGLGRRSIRTQWVLKWRVSRAWQTSGALTADEASSLKTLSTGIRTSLQTGDTTAARTAVDSLSTTVDSFAAKLDTDARRQLIAAIAALKSALPSS